MAGDLLETEGLSKEFKGFAAVAGVDLRVRAGTVHALIGPNGAGKTTCFNLITRFLDPTGGVIRFKGKDVTRLHPSLLAEQGMVRSFQISATFPHLTLLENVRVALQRKVGYTFHFWRSERRHDDLDARAREILKQVDLADLADERAADLSYGRKRMLEIATTLALEPEMLLLDEPTSGMGHEDIARVTSLIKTAARRSTILMVEHNLGVVSELSDRITVLTRGRVLAEGAYADIASRDDVREAYLGSEGT